MLLYDTIYEIGHHAGLAAARWGAESDFFLRLNLIDQFCNGILL